MKPIIPQRAFQSRSDSASDDTSNIEPDDGSGAGVPKAQDAPADIKTALTHLSTSVKALKEAVAYRKSLEDGNGDLRGEVSRLNEERKRLAAKLDQAEGRLATQSQVTQDVSGRLGTAMEAIRSVLESQAK